jgi:lysophospholipase L1-like esterase
MVVLGESTVQGGGWIASEQERWADLLAALISECQDQPIEYVNKGIGANSISTRSPGYEASAKPSAIERYRKDVIEEKPDLFLLCYGLNDMRCAMPLDEFIGEMRTIIRDTQKECDALIVLTTVYYMTGWRSYPPFDKGSEALTLEYNAAIAKLADEENCLLADIWEGEDGADWVINPCGVHANKVGNLLIAHAVFRAIATNCSALSIMTQERDSTTEWAVNTSGARERDGDPFDPWWKV